jgi:hypothetical protein
MSTETTQPEGLDPSRATAATDESKVPGRITPDRFRQPTEYMTRWAIIVTMVLTLILTGLEVVSVLRS